MYWVREVVIDTMQIDFSDTVIDLQYLSKVLASQFTNTIALLSVVVLGNGGDNGSTGSGVVDT